MQKQATQKYFLPALLFLLFLAIPLQIVQAQGFYTQFGQNRVQYQDFEWSYYESENFVTYFYQGGFDLGKFTVQVAEESLNDIATKLEYRPNNKIQVLVYHNLADLKQTNIGLGTDLSNNNGGYTKIINNKIFVYFNGNHADLQTQIRTGIAHVCIQNMLNGSNIQEYVQNAVLLNLPTWFIGGLEAYLGKAWSVEDDDRLRNLNLKKKFAQLSNLQGEEATFLGKAFWNYVVQIYGSATVPNLLYITRLNHSLANGFVFVLGADMNTTTTECANYFETIYANDQKGKTALNDQNEVVLKKNIWQKNSSFKKQAIINHLKVSPSGTYIAYTTNQNGKQKVWLYNTQNQKHRILTQYGYESYNFPTDNTYPFIAWDKKGEQLAVIYERRNQIRFFTYLPAENKKIKQPNITKFQQILGVCFTDNPEKLILSADKNGQVDLFYYGIPNTQVTQITNDFYDELQPQTVQIGNKKGIVFASNHASDTLHTQKLDTIMPLNNTNIYFYNTQTRDSVLVQITNTPLANEWQPTAYNNQYLTFLSTENGITNQYVAQFDSIYIRTDKRVYLKDKSLLINPPKLDSLLQLNIIDTVINNDIYKTIAITHPITNQNTNIIHHDIALKAQKSWHLYKKNNQYAWYTFSVDSLPFNKKINPEPTFYQKQLKNLSQFLGKKSKAVINENKTNIIKNEYIQKDTTVLPPPTPIPPKPTPSPTDSIDINNYFFQSEFDYQPATTNPTAVAAPPTLLASAQAPTTEPMFKRTRIRIYKPLFLVDHLVSQMDNTTSIYNQYQSFNAGPVGYTTPNLNAMFKVGITDLFEDYKLLGGFSLPTNLSGSEYFIEFQNLKRQLDKKLLGYRKAFTGTYSADNDVVIDTVVQAKTITQYIQYTLSYPFDFFSRVSLQGGLRNDKIHILADRPLTLNAYPSPQENWAYLKAEYVFDNTVPIMQNILTGMRYKIYAEAQKPFDFEISQKKIDFGVKNTGFLGILGFDSRFYKKIHKQIIFAGRVAGAHSFGSRKMIYYLGGTENWLNFSSTKFDYDTPIDVSKNYGFQSLATNLRGYRQNVRNGSSYAVLNTELRVPLFVYLTNNKVQNNFLRSFQMIGFFDAGTAWEGTAIFSKDNHYEIKEIEQIPVSVRVKYFKNPLVAGYGWGMRAQLFGYFVRLDRSYVPVNFTESNPRWYISLGMDF